MRRYESYSIPISLCARDCSTSRWSPGDQDVLAMRNGSIDLLVVDFEPLVRNEQDGHVLGRRRAVLHHRPLWKPDEMARPILPLMRHQRSFEDVHSVRARMCVRRIDRSGGIANQPDFHAGVGILDKVLAI